MKKIFRLMMLSCLLCSIFSFGYAKNLLIVDYNGSGDYLSLQEAIDNIRAFDPAGTTTIFVKNGIYKEKIKIPTHVGNLHIIGESRENTIITYNDHAKTDNMGTFKTYTLLIRGNDITLENLTIRNDAEPIAQAVALHLEGDRIIVRNCRILGNQDTLYTGREACRHYFEECYIEGTTDYIFGPSTCWFEKCELHCKKNSYITAASTPAHIPYGYVFNHCTITLAEEAVAVYLGRPWRPYAMTLFMNCYIPEGIHPKGWHNWKNVENEATARYMEYNNRGPGSDTSGRVLWSNILTNNEITRYPIEMVMNGWNPALKK